jgi:hypothetical protein
MGCLSPVNEMQSDCQSTKAVDRKAEGLLQHMHQGLSLVTIQRAWKTKLLQMEPDKAQRDHASDCFASTRPGGKRFAASTDEFCRISGLSITKCLLKAQADVEKAGEPKPKFQGPQPEIVVQPTRIGLKAGRRSEDRRQTSQMNHKKQHE